MVCGGFGLGQIEFFGLVLARISTFSNNLDPGRKCGGQRIGAMGIFGLGLARRVCDLRIFVKFGLDMGRPLSDFFDFRWSFCDGEFGLGVVVCWNIQTRLVNRFVKNY